MRILLKLKKRELHCIHEGVIDVRTYELPIRRHTSALKRSVHLNRQNLVSSHRPTDLRVLKFSMLTKKRSIIYLKYGFYTNFVSNKSST